jgi:hypothetical protein
VKIHVTDPTLVEDLAEMLRSAQLVVVRAGPQILDVHFGSPVREDAARLELDLYLRVWEASHAGAHAVRVSD